ncbi:hypothetical protein BSKO_13765 [Bryopsis sp. KO-2023]|nr:hypothetical protein BSKO_13765 [Bryopsis sp. KO-2023]
MNDLLGDIRSGGGDSQDGFGSGRDIESGPTPTAASPTDDAMQKFFAMVEEIKNDMSKIREKQKSLRDSHERSKTVTRAAEMKNLREQMQDDINAVSKQAHGIKAMLEALDKSNAESLKQKDCGPGSSTERMRTSITAGLKKRLKDLMSEFTELRKRVQKEYREVVERRVRAVTGKHASEDEIDRIIETGEGETVFQQAFLDQGKGKAMDTLAEIRERQRAVRDLEQSLLELHQIFLDMAVLVEVQGEMLDNIERQVAQSVDYVGGAVTALTDARRFQTKARKLRCCAIICLLIIIAVILLAVLQPWN